MSFIEPDRLFRVPSVARMAVRPGQHISLPLAAPSQVVITDIYIEKPDAGVCNMTIGFERNGHGETPYTLEVGERYTQIHLESGWHLTAGVGFGADAIVLGNSSGSPCNIVPIVSGYLVPDPRKKKKKTKR